MRMTTVRNHFIRTLLIILLLLFAGGFLRNARRPVPRFGTQPHGDRARLPLEVSLVFSYCAAKEVVNRAVSRLHMSEIRS